MDTNNIFSNYISQKSENTLSAQRIDLVTFTDYRRSIDDNFQFNATDLQTNAEAWDVVTAKLVEGFIQWMFGQGFAISSINRKLSTVKMYAKLASIAGSLNYIESALIRNIVGPTTNEGKHIDRTRPIVRKGAKKATSTLLSQEQAQILKKHPNTPQGYRDSLLMCLLLDHGLRVGEISLLKTLDFDLEVGQFTLYRPKLDLIQTLKMTPDTFDAVKTWFKSGCATTVHLLRGSLKSGQLNEGGMSERAIQTRVKVLGKNLIGLDRLSPEDCRHYWATHALELGADLLRLEMQGAGSLLPCLAVTFPHQKLLTNVSKYKSISPISTDKGISTKNRFRQNLFLVDIPLSALYLLNRGKRTRCGFKRLLDLCFAMRRGQKACFKLRRRDVDAVL